MINKLRFLFVVTLFAAMAIVTNAQTSVASGNWSASATWAGGVVPTSGAPDVIIANGHTVTIDAAGAVGRKVTVNSGGTLIINGSGGATFARNLIVDGTLTINTTGTVSIGSAGTTFSLDMAKTSAATATFTAGTINIKGQLIVGSSTIASSLTINGATVNIDPQSLAGDKNTFVVGSSATLSFSSGTVTILNPITAQLAGGKEISFGGSGVNISGTALIILGQGGSTLASAQGYRVNCSSTSELQNLTLNTNTVGVNLVSNLSVKGTLTLSTGTLSLDAFALTIANPISGTPENLSAGSTSSLSIGGTSSGINIPSNITALNNLTLNNSNGSTLQASLTISGTLTMTNGAINLNSNTLTYGASSTLAFNGTSAQTSTDVEFPSTSGPASLILNNSAGVSIHAARTLTGMLTLGGNNSYTNLSNISGYSGITYSATTAQSTGAEFGGIITNLTINNSIGVTLGGNKAVTGTLTLTSGNLALNGQTLTLGSSSASFGALKYTAGNIIGSGTFTRWFGTTALSLSDSTGLFPIGVGANSRSLSIGGTPTSGGTVSVSYTDANTVSTPFGPSFSENSQSFVNRYDANWNVAVADGFASSLTLAIKGNGIPGISAIGDLNVSGATAAAPGTYAATTGSTSAPVLNRTGLSETTLPSTYYIASTSTSALPVELQSFTAKTNRGSVELNWSTATEVNNAGFEIEKNVIGSWSKIGFVEGFGTTNAPQSYSFVDANIVGKIQYRLKQIDRDGKFEYSSAVEVSVAATPAVLTLNDNYPNPFNPTTKIDFTVPFTGHAVVKVYNSIGQEAAVLFNGVAEAGRVYQTFFNAKNLASGMYFSRLEFNGKILVKKMLLTK